jgi:UDP-2,4-diacetamido-2,4,6-trideoxy-beta-L-altropyranose hydrolase
MTYLHGANYLARILKFYKVKFKDLIIYIVKIGILAATGKYIGLGHIKRCLSIAIELKKISHDIEFLLEDCYYTDWILKEGFAIKRSLSTFHKYDLIIIDKYHVDITDLRYLKNHCRKLARIDDGVDITDDFISDILINGNPYADKNHYLGHLREDCDLVLGKDYIPMDQRFCALRKKYKIRKNADTLLITFGGSSDYTYVKKVCEEVSRYGIFKEIVVLNGLPLRNILKADVLNKLHLLPLLSEFDNLLLQSDIALCSASSTCWQLSTMGLPFICIKTASNQEHVYDYICKTGIGIALNQLDLQQGNLKMLFSKLGYHNRNLLSVKSRELIDCLGSCRIAKRVDEVLLK